MAVSITCFIACDKEDKGGESSQVDKGITTYANLNPADPVILDVSNKQGQSMVIMGTKDSKGAPKAIKDVIIYLSQKENPTEIKFGDNKKVKEMIASNGVRFLFDWLSNTEIALTLIDPNTNEQLNTVIDLTENDNKTKTSTVTRSGDVAPRTGSSTLTVEHIKEETPAVSQIITTRGYGDIIGNVYLERCGMPADGTCWVDVYHYNITGVDAWGKFRGRYYCDMVAKGHYQVRLPSDYKVNQKLSDYCFKIAGVIGELCSWNDYTAPGSGVKQLMCIKISAALASGIVSAPVAAGFLAACESATSALDTACSALNGFADLPPGAPNVADSIICKNIKKYAEYEWKTPYFLVPVVSAIPKNIVGTSELYEVDGVIKDMKVSFGGDPAIASFMLDPAAPAQNQSYQAIAVLFCLPEGSKVTMEIVGTDGYSNSKTITIGASETMQYKATLKVPGAKSGVKDVCTVTAVTPDGETVTKKASLVFK